MKEDEEMSKFDDAAHEIFKSFNKQKWNSFFPEMFDQYEREHECFDYYEYYYAENELYLIRNVLSDEIYFVRARSPAKAYLSFSCHLCECHGNIYRGRDYSYEDFMRDFCGNCVNCDECDHIPIENNGHIMDDFRNDCRDFEYVDFDVEH